ncbi:MAG: Gfo/Idh/MocA family protein [Dehalococcoidia bacterium]
MLSGALIGAGNIARNGHLPAYLESPGLANRLRIVAAVDPCSENRAAIAATLPGVRLYAEAHHLLDAERLDFVDICTPPFAHRRLIEQSLRAGCHVLCEKPLATDLGDASAIRSAAIEAHRVVMPCHQYHHAPQWLTLRRLLESGRIGEVRLATLNVLRVGANLGNGAWRPAWRTDGELAGGGILVDHGTHLFYQLHAVFGPPDEIACRTERRLPYSTVDDTATLYLRYPRRLVRLHLTWAAASRSTLHRYVGTLGEIACLDDHIEVRDGRGSESIPFGEALSHGSAHSTWFSPLLSEFADRIERRDYRTDRLDEGVLTAAYLTLAYASAAQGGTPLDWIDPLAPKLEPAYAAAD